MRSSLLSLALLLSACGSGVNNLTLPIEPLGTVKGRVNRTELAARQTGTKLRAAIAWVGVPRYDELCGEWKDKNETLGEICADPLQFVQGETQSMREITLAEDGSFELPLMQLPSANVAVGDPSGRISYGSLVISEEMLLPDLPPDMVPPPSERLLAASFTTIAKPQQRLVFREGLYDAESYFYPASGCEAPPTGFSVLLAPAYAAQPPYGTCEIASLDRPIELTVLDEDEAARLQCWRPQTLIVAPEELTPFDGSAPDLSHFECLDHERGFRTYPEDPCRSIDYVPLKGCYQDSECKDPQWDNRSNPPSWWPC